MRSPLLFGPGRRMSAPKLLGLRLAALGLPAPGGPGALGGFGVARPSSRRAFGPRPFGPAGRHGSRMPGLGDPLAFWPAGHASPFGWRPTGPGSAGLPGVRGPRGFAAGEGRHDQSRPPAPADGAAGWFAGRIPDDWFIGPPHVSVDRDEIVVVGTLSVPEIPEGATEDDRAEAEAGRIRRFREQTREQRMRLADEAEARYGRKTAWGARAGGAEQLFTSLAVPVTAALRQPERLVLNHLVAAGAAGSWSEALELCVRLTGQQSATSPDQPRQGT